jgi:tetratricopeptide (TPR) repeat protein
MSCKPLIVEIHHQCRILLYQTLPQTVTKKHNRTGRKTVELSKEKRRAFFVVTFAFPLAFFVLLEMSLRLLNYGPDLSLFTTEVLAGRTYHVMNPAVKGRYFSTLPFSPSTSPDYFVVPKPPGTFRIFCLGGSTTVGYPYWYNGSFSSFLRDRLRHILPERELEIINVGMTATNSFTVNDMVRDIVDYEPDLLIVYDGHNEFYGALGVASNESVARARWLTKLYLRLIHVRTFVLLRDFVNAIVTLFAEPSVTQTGATMMERLAYGQLIPYDSDLYRAGLEIYKANLEELKSLTASHGIPVILGSQVSNLRGLAPFVSGHPERMPLEGKAAFNTAFNRGLTHHLNGQLDSALTAFKEAAALSPLHAEAHFRAGRMLDTLGRKREAGQSYIMARDLDLLRFRMSTDFNNALKTICDDDKFLFVDMEQKFREHSPDSLIGYELIVEHLHPNAQGFFLMAQAYAAMMEQRGLLAPPAMWTRLDSVAERRLWDDRPVTDLDELIAQRRTEILVSGWPFSSRSIPVVSSVADSDTLGQIVENVTRARWNWQQAHNAAMEYHARRGDWHRVERECRTLINQLPLVDVQPYLQLARLWVNQQRFDEARTVLLASIPVKPTILAYRALGDLALNSGSPAEAVPFYEKTFTFPQQPAEKVENGYLLALALSRAGMSERAATELLKVLAIKPDHHAAAALLAQIRGNR